MNHRSLGVLGFTDELAGKELVRFVQRLEEQGYESFWVPEAHGREPLSTCGYLLAETSRIRIATGIANVYVRDPVATETARRNLAEYSDGRFELGLGVSHASVNEVRGHTWIPPVQKLRGYLDAMEAAPAAGPAPSQPAPVVIAAHGPKLMALAAERADGCLTHLSPPPRTAMARKTLGPSKTVRPLVCACLCDGEAEGRAAAREALSIYLTLPAYHKLWEACGFSAEDWQDGFSDPLIDALCAWGDRARIMSFVEKHHTAGADQVLIYPVGQPGKPSLSQELFDALAPEG